MDIPKSLDECKRTDGTASAVWTWAESFERWGRIILIILLVVGIIETILSGISAAEAEIEGMAFWIVISSLIKWVSYALIEYAVYNFISTLLYALGSIVESARASAKIELYKLSKEEVSEDRRTEETSWTCVKCGRRNSSHERTCFCGISRYNT